MNTPEQVEQANKELYLRTKIHKAILLLKSINTKAGLANVSSAINQVIEEARQSGIPNLKTPELEAALEETQQVVAVEDRKTRELYGQTESVTIGDSNKALADLQKGYPELKQETEKSIAKLNKENKELDKLMDSWDKGKKPDANALLPFIKTQEEIEKEQKRLKKLFEKQKKADAEYKKIKNQINALQEELKSGNLSKSALKQKTNALEVLKTTFAQIAKTKLDIDNLVKKEKEARTERGKQIKRLKEIAKANPKDKEFTRVVGLIEEGGKAITTGKPLKMKKERKEALKLKSELDDVSKMVKKRKSKKSILTKLKNKASSMIKTKKKLNNKVIASPVRNAKNLGKGNKKSRGGRG